MIYLDYSANTPVDEAVLQRFCEVERNCPGNANSRHAAGTAAKAAIDAATQSIARSLNVQPAEIIYTSGASGVEMMCLPWWRSSRAMLLMAKLLASLAPDV